MKKRKAYLWLLGELALLLLAACSPGDADVATEPDATTAPRLNTDYEDALTVQGQLALGTLQLDETEMAVDETQAAELLPLWQALQSLGNSDTASSVEIDAVINQIQDTMTPDQMQAIADMALTTESFTELADSGAFGRVAGFGGFFGGSDGDGNSGGGFPGGFARGEPGGGGPGGGVFRQEFGGFPGGGFAGGNFDEDALATRQAQFADNDGNFQDRIITGFVIRLLQTKTGEASEFPVANPAGIIMSAVSEATGLSNADIRAQMAEGSTLADVITVNGGIVSEVRDNIIEALNALPNAAELDAEQLADDWLNGNFGQAGEQGGARDES